MKRSLITMGIAMVCVVLAGCGGGGSGTGPVSQPEPTQQTAPAADAAQVLYLGDSTRTSVYAGEPSIPDLVAVAVGARVNNQAVSGTMAWQAPLDLICSSGVKVVAANFGINDSEGRTLEQYRVDLTAIVERGRSCGVRTVLEEANPIVPGGRWSSARSDERVKAFDAVKREVAAATGATYCALPNHVWTLADLPDGIHPAMAAKAMEAPALAECIKPHL